MPLELYRRRSTWWFKGRIDDLPASRYYRQSTGTSDEAKARRQVTDFEAREIKGHYVGQPKTLTFAEAVCLYKCNEATANYLDKLIPSLGSRECAEISGKEVRDVARRLYPEASADTWQRQVLTPVSAVINNAHDDGNRCPPIRIKGFSATERIDQDRRRGKPSRQQKQPGSWEWIEAFRAAALDQGQPHIAGLALLMFVKGCRVSQAVALVPDDLDLQQHRLRMPAAKGWDAQWVDIPVELVVELANLEPKAPRARYQSHVAEMMQAALASHGSGGSGIAEFQTRGEPLRAHAVASPTGAAPIVRWYRGETRITKKAAATIARTRIGTQHPVRVFGFADRWSVEKAWEKVCSRAELERIMPHAAGRHGFGTEAISRLGIDPASAAKEGRWSSASLMLDTYSHPVETSASIQEQFRQNRAGSSSVRVQKQSRD